MKRKLILFFLSVALFAQPAALIPTYTVEAAAATGASGKKLNLISAAQCLVIEPNYKAEDSQNLTPGSSFAKDPYIKSETNSDAYCFARIEIPTTTFTTVDGTEVVGDAVKMLYGGKEGINTSDWKVVKEIPSATPGTNSVYVVQYIGNSGVLKKQTSTGRIFDSMTMPQTISVAKVSKQVTSADDTTGSVSVQGFLVSSSDAKDATDAYSSIKDKLEKNGSTSDPSNTTSDSNQYEEKLQREVDTLQKEKRNLETQVAFLEDKIISGLSVGDAKANEVISGKVFSNIDGIDQTGTMPNYDIGYYGSGNTNETYSWTDINGATHTQNKEGYQTVIKNGTGLTRNTDGTITISAGYHAQQTVQAASGNASPNQVLNGVTFSNSSGPQVGTMPNNTTRTSNGNVPGINSWYSNIPTRDGSALQYSVDTSGTARINICPPEGYYQGDRGSYVSAPASYFGNAIAAHVLSGEYFTSSSGLNISGTMPNHGAYTDAINYAVSGGKTYIRIPQGAYIQNTVVGSPEIVLNQAMYTKEQYDKAYAEGYAAGKQSVRVYVYFKAHLFDNVSRATLLVQKDGRTLINKSYVYTNVDVVYEFTD